MRQAQLLAHGELVDHLGPERAGGRFFVQFELPVGVRDLVQSCGIPHVEVGRLEVDGGVAEWTARVDGGASIELWPRYPMDHAEPDARFLLDVHLGKLARLLRLLGFDTAYGNDATDDELAEEAVVAERNLLTRDRGLLMRSVVERGRWLRATDPETQASEVVGSFGLADRTLPFSRCMDCNGLLEAVDPSEVTVPAGVAGRHVEYRRCEGCARVYWPGSHHAGLEEVIDRILSPVV